MTRLGGGVGQDAARSARRPFRRLAFQLSSAVLAVAIAACLPSGAGPTLPPGPSTGVTPAPASAGVRAQLQAALSARNLILDDAKVPFRPAEPPELAGVGRTVYRVQLRDDPEGGFVVAYQLANAQAAASAGASLSAYLSSGPGRVQSPLGTVHVIRQLGSALLYYHWLPSAAVDPLTPGIQAALETLGTGVPVAS